MMMKDMMGNMNGGSPSASSGLSSILPIMMLSGGNFSNMFEGIFDFDTDNEDEEAFNKSNNASSSTKRSPKKVASSKIPKKDIDCEVE